MVALAEAHTGTAAPPWPVPEDEPARLAALEGYGLLDSRRADLEAELQAAARLAAHACGARRAAIHLIDADQQVPAATYGDPASAPTAVARESALCAHVVTGTALVHVPDASRDERFRDSPFVAGPLDAVRMYAAAPLLTHEGRAIGSVCVVDGSPRTLAPEQLGLLADVAGLVMAVLERRRLTAALVRSAGTDPLTGLASRRTVQQAVAKAIARAERGLGTPSVVVIDLDRFAAVTETRGHAAGDALLQEVAERLQSTARTVDTVARVGGDQFLVLLEHTGGPGAAAALRRIRAALDDLSAEGGAAVTASVGITTYRPGDGVASLISRADAEMYAAKARG